MCMQEGSNRASAQRFAAPPKLRHRYRSCSLHIRRGSAWRREVHHAGRDLSLALRKVQESSPGDPLAAPVLPETMLQKDDRRLTLAAPLLIRLRLEAAC